MLGNCMHYDIIRGKIKIQEREVYENLKLNIKGNRLSRNYIIFFIRVNF